MKATVPPGLVAGQDANAAKAPPPGAASPIAASDRGVSSSVAKIAASGPPWRSTRTEGDRVAVTERDALGEAAKMPPLGAGLPEAGMG